jgi:hypothetical protein
MNHIITYIIIGLICLIILWVIVILCNLDTSRGTYTNIPSSTIRIYDACNYQGHYIDLNIGNYDITSLGLTNDHVGSIQIPEVLGWSVKLHQQSDVTLTFTNTSSCVPQEEWVEVTVSMNDNSISGAKFFVDCDYQGQSVVLGVGRYNQSQMGLPTKSLSSLQVPQGFSVTLYDQVNFKGLSITFNSNQRCLIDQGWNDRTSSLVVEKV